MKVLLNFIINNFYKIENKILGRWCHLSMPKCCQKVIEKKIDFANKDNSF